MYVDLNAVKNSVYSVICYKDAWLQGQPVYVVADYKRAR